MPPDPIPVALSTASVWPEGVEAAFELAVELGYDGIEVMIWADPVSQDVSRLDTLVHRYGIPVLALHAPCLLITQRVWTPDPVLRLDRTVHAAGVLGTPTVVVHPPFRWQRRYARGFADQVARLEADSGVAIAVENMFPVRRGNLVVSSFAPSVDPTDVGHAHYTLDLSHTSAARMDAVHLARRMGPRLHHLHLADGTGEPRDEHLVPGRGDQPCERVCHDLAASGFAGTVCLEVSTRRARTRDERARDLDAALRFARTHLDRSVPHPAPSPR